MKQILVILFIFCLLIIPVSAEIDEKALKKNFGDLIMEQIVRITGLDVGVQDAIDEIDSEITDTAKKVCKETFGIRALISILTLLTIIGLITFYPAGILAGIVELFVILNYTCWFF